MSEQLLKEILSELKSVNQRLDKLEGGQQKLQHSLARIENDHGEKLRGIYDAREVQFDVNERICETLGRMEGKFDRMILKVSSHDAILQRVK